MPKPGSTTIPSLLVGAIAAACVFAFAAMQWDPDFSFNIEYDAYLSAGLALARHGEFPRFGPAIAPTNLFLGPAFPVLLGVGLFLTGESLHGTWLFLAGLTAAGVGLAGFAFARMLGWMRAAVFCGLLASMPFMYHEMSHFPFWHQHFNLPFLSLFVVGLLALKRQGRAWGWYAAVVGAALAIQMHVTTLVLLPLLALAAGSARKSLGGRRLCIGAVILALLSWWVPAQWSALAEPSRWMAILVRHGDGAETASRLLSVLANRVSFVAAQAPAGVPLVAAGLVIALARVIRRRDDRPVTGLEGLTLGWTSLGSALVCAMSHRWHDHYDFLFLIPIALSGMIAFDELLRFAHRRGIPHAAVQGGSVLLVLALPANLLLWTPPPSGYKRAPAIRRAASIEALIDGLAATGGVPRDLGLPLSSIHGLPCDEPDWPMCHSRFFLDRAGACAPCPGFDRVVAFRPDGHVDVETRHEHIIVGATSDTLHVLSSRGAKPHGGWLVVAAALPRFHAPGETPPPLPDRWLEEIALPPMHQVRVFRSAAPLSLQEGTMRVALPPDAVPTDAWLSATCPNAASLGFDVLPSRRGTL